MDGTAAGNFSLTSRVHLVACCSVKRSCCAAVADCRPNRVLAMIGKTEMITQMTTWLEVEKPIFRPTIGAMATSGTVCRMTAYGYSVRSSQIVWLIRTATKVPMTKAIVRPLTATTVVRARPSRIGCSRSQSKNPLDTTSCGGGRNARCSSRSSPYVTNSQRPITAAATASGGSDEAGEAEQRRGSLRSLDRRPYGDVGHRLATSSRSIALLILPVGVIGMTSMISTRRPGGIGVLAEPMYVSSVATPTSAPSTSVTKATGRSPPLSSGRPMSAASRTATWRSERFLDLSRVPVGAVDAEALRQPAAHEHVPFGVHHPDVARAQPAAAERFAGLVRPLPVPRHEAATQAQLADDPGGHLVARRRRGRAPPCRAMADRRTPHGPR